MEPSTRRLAVIGVLLTVVLAGLWVVWRLRAAGRPELGPAGEDVRTALVYLQPSGESRVQGTILLTRTDDGSAVLLTYEIRRLPPGVHGLRILEEGGCAASDAHRAGPGYGDLGTIAGNELGYLKGALVVRNVRLAAAPKGILGRPLAIASPEQPVACGLIRAG